MDVPTATAASASAHTLRSGRSGFIRSLGGSIAVGSNSSGRFQSESTACAPKAKLLLLGLAPSRLAGRRPQKPPTATASGAKRHSLRYAPPPSRWMDTPLRAVCLRARAWLSPAGRGPSDGSAASATDTSHQTPDGMELEPYTAASGGGLRCRARVGVAPTRTAAGTQVVSSRPPFLLLAGSAARVRARTADPKAKRRDWFSAD